MDLRGTNALLEPEQDRQLTVAERSDALLTALAADPGDRDARAALASLCLPWVEQLARRFRGRGEPIEDLMQVARLGLIKAIERFDIERGVRFVTYLTPIVLGELKRHFRDNGWAMHVPRRLQELSLEVRATIDGSYQELRRAPTVGEVAERIGRSEDEVIEALETSGAYAVDSLDAPIDEERLDQYGTLGKDDHRLEMLEGWVALAPHLRALPERDRAILHMRFVLGMVQGQIAERLGISQMHVSRLLADIIRRLRAAVVEPSVSDTAPVELARDAG